MSYEEDPTVYEGTVLKLTADGTKYIIKSKDASAWYGVDPRLPAAERPKNINIGDAISFGVMVYGNGAPMVSWAEKSDQAKRKAEEVDVQGPKAGEELYQGKVRAQSTKDPSFYFVECSCVTEWFGREARVSSEKLFLASSGLGDSIVFSLVPEDPSAAAQVPTAAWVESKDVWSRKKRKIDSDKAKAKAEAQAIVAPVGVKGIAEGMAGGDELSKLKAQLLEERNALLEAKLEIANTKISLAGGVSGGIQVVRQATSPPPKRRSVAQGPGLPSDTEDEGPASSHNNAGGKAKEAGAAQTGPTMTAVIRFGNTWESVAAAALYGTEIDGQEVKPVIDPHETCVVKVPGLKPETSTKDLKDLFSECGKILSLNTTVSKGQRQSKGKGGEGKGGGKGGGKPAAADASAEDEDLFAAPVAAEGEGKGKGKGKGKKGKEASKGASKGKDGGKDGAKGAGGKPAGGAAKGGAKGAGGKGAGGGQAAGGAGGQASSMAAELTFGKNDEAESCLALYDSQLEEEPGFSLAVELQSCGLKVRVSGIPQGVQPSMVKKHFKECGEITNIRMLVRKAKTV